MNLPEQVLGKATAAKLKARASAPILTVGSDTFTRRELMVKADCSNFNAAQNLSRLLNEHLNVPNLKHVFYKVPPTALALPRLGAVSLAVLGAAFEARGLGGSEPLLNYIRQHTHANGNGAASVDDLVVTFDTLKYREQKEHAEERKRYRQRKHARRNQAHHLRLARRAG